MFLIAAKKSSFFASKNEGRRNFSGFSASLRSEDSGRKGEIEEHVKDDVLEERGRGGEVVR